MIIISSVIIHPSIYPSIHPSIHLNIHTYIHTTHRGTLALQTNPLSQIMKGAPASKKDKARQIS